MTLIVAVIGDVAADWAFISNEPARPQSAFQPWNQHPSTHMFAFPGGAWFSGAVIQGALSDPIFTRIYSAEVTRTDPSETRLCGTLGSPFSNMAQSPVFGATRIWELHITVDSEVTLIINDTTEVKLPSSGHNGPFILRFDDDFSSITRTHIEIGLTDAHLEFAEHTGKRAGRLIPDIFNRRFDLRQASLLLREPPRALPSKEASLMCSYLVLSNPVDGLPCVGSVTGMHGKLTSLRFVSEMQREGLSGSSCDIRAYAQFIHADAATPTPEAAPIAIAHDFRTGAGAG